MFSSVRIRLCVYMTMYIHIQCVHMCVFEAHILIIRDIFEENGPVGLPKDTRKLHSEHNILSSCPVFGSWETLLMVNIITY